MPTPDPRYFASQWNIGFTCYVMVTWIVFRVVPQVHAVFWVLFVFWSPWCMYNGEHFLNVHICLFFFQYALNL